MRPSKIRAAARGIMAKVAPSAKSATMRCHNLRTEILPTGETVLRPVGRPEPVAEGAWWPLTKMSPAPGVEMLIVADGCRLGAIDLVGADCGAGVVSTESVSLIAVTDSEISCAVSFGDMLTVMTADGPRRMAYDAGESAWLLIDPSEWTALSLTAHETADCTATVAPRRLSGDYSSASEPLNDSDRRAVTGDLRRAYTEVVSQAAAAGVCCAPAIVRYRLVSHDGSTLCISPPLLLGPRDSGRLTAPVAVTSDDRRTLDGYEIAARGWRPAVVSSRPVSKAMAAAVSRIEILACPQFHPFDPSGEAVAVLVNDPADRTMLRLTMPGAGLSVSSGNAAAGESRLRRMLAVQADAEQVVAVIRGPFAEGSVIDCEPRLTLPYSGVDDECRAVAAALARRPETVSDSQSRISPPHAFAAACCASAAGNVLWGSLEALRFRGWSADFFAGSRAGAGAWRSAVAVTFASGDEQLVAVAQGTEGAPAELNPVLSYPSADAVAMTLIVSAGGKVRRTTVPLTPLPSGDMSVYVSPGFAPFVPEGEAQTFVIPAERRVRKPLPGFVAAARADAPTAAVSLAPVGDGEVSALFPASRSQSSWDFSRVRFSALTSRGIYAVTLSGASLSVSLVDSRGVVGRHAAADAAGRLLAVASGNLVEVGASRAVTLLSDFDADVLAYATVRDELWGSAADDGLTAVVDLSTLQSATRDDAVRSPSLDAYAVVGGSLCRLGAETPAAGSVYVRWDCAISVSDDFVRPVGLTFDMRSRSVAYGSLAVRRVSTADEEPSPSLRLSLDGRQASPLKVALPALPLRRAAVSFQGRVSPDTVISAVTLSYIKD